MKYVIVTAPEGYHDTVRAVLDGAELKDIWWEAPTASRETFTVRFVSGFGEDKKLLDALQQALLGTDSASIHIMNIDATYPNPDPLFVTPKLSREELYRIAEDGARSDSLYLLLVALSTIVAAIGLMQGNVAVIIGAMVIAPLLGPNLSIALAAALGEYSITKRAIVACAKGVAISLGVSVLIGLLWPDFAMNDELRSRTSVGIGSAVLGFASGMAAVLSMTSGVQAVLVGVMVAVALIPPLATAGLLLGQGDWLTSLAAILLLVVNVAAINAAAHITLHWSEITPRSVHAASSAKLRNYRFIFLWSVVLILASSIAVWWGR